MTMYVVQRTVGGAGECIGVFSSLEDAQKSSVQCVVKGMGAPNAICKWDDHYAMWITRRSDGKFGDIHIIRECPVLDKPTRLEP